MMKRLLLILILLTAALSMSFADVVGTVDATSITTVYTVKEGAGTEVPDKDAASALGYGIFVQVQNLNGDWTALDIIDRNDNAFEEGTSKEIKLRFLMARNSSTSHNLEISVASQGWKHDSVGDNDYIEGITGKDIIIGQFTALSDIPITSGIPSRFKNAFDFNAPRQQLALKEFAQVSLTWEVATGMMAGQYTADVRVEMTTNN